MSPTSNPPASGLLARLTGIVVRPRSAMRAAAAAGAGAVAAAWLVVLVVWLAAGAWLLALPVGRQALVDEQVRVVEALGGTVDDARYQAWQAAPPWGTYFTSGGRLLLLPLTTLAVATGLYLWTRRQVPGVRYAAALSVTVHASVILALQQVVATPLHIVRESLTSPFNLAALAPLFDEGSWPARAARYGRAVRGVVGPAAGAGRRDVDRAPGPDLRGPAARDLRRRGRGRRRRRGPDGRIVAVFRKKWPWVVGLLVVLGVAAGAYSRSRQEKGTLITAETVQQRDLEAIVSASGKIDPKRSVNISAQAMGRVTRIGVREGDRVTAGQFLLQIDPVAVESAVRRDEAAVAGARTGLEQSRVQVQSAQAGLDVARQALKRQRELWEGGLTTRENVEKAEADVQMRESDLNARTQEIKTREEQVHQQEAGLVSSRYNLSQARFVSPFDGIVTRRNIEEGENVVVGTMNNAGTVLLTVADMSVIEAEVEVDETDVPLVEIGQKATVTIDAIDGKTFSGRVTEIGNSPIQPATGQAPTGTGPRTATNFKVTITLDAGGAGDSSGIHLHRRHLHGQQEQRRVGADPGADRARARIRQGRRPRAEAAAAAGVALELRAGPAETAATAPTELPVGHTRKEVEGVFVVKNGKAAFVPVEVGIAGERYFEVLKGLSQGDRVITGPFDSVRNLFEADDVREAPPAAAR